MHKDIQHIKDFFLTKSSFTKFFYKDDVLIYLDQDFTNGDITILLCQKGGNQYMGKLRFSLRGKLRESDVLTDKDLADLVSAMRKLWEMKRCEQLTISRDEFLQAY
jgi:hypothetical protein